MGKTDDEDFEHEPISDIEFQGNSSSETETHITKAMDFEFYKKVPRMQHSSRSKRVSLNCQGKSS